MSNISQEIKRYSKDFIQVAIFIHIRTNCVTTCRRPTEVDQSEWQKLKIKPTVRCKFSSLTHSLTHSLTRSLARSLTRTWVLSSSDLFLSFPQLRAASSSAALLPTAFLWMCLFPRHFIQTVFDFHGRLEFGSGRRRCHFSRHHRRLSQRSLSSRSLHRRPFARVVDIV